MKKIAVFFVAGVLLVGVLFLARLPGGARDSVLTTAAGLREYRLGTHPVTLKLPRTTRVVAETPGTDDMLYSAFFQDEALRFRGYVQLWRIEDLGKFLADSKEHSRFDFKEFKQKRIKLKGCEGFQIDWEAVMQDNRPASGRDYFLKKEGSREVLRLSLFSETTGFPKELAEVADTVVSSIEWKQTAH